MKRYFLYVCLLVIVLACGSPRKTTTTVQTSAYKKEVNAIHPQFVVYNSSDSITELHYKIASKELLYTRPNGMDFTSNVLISFRLYASFDSKDIIDSGSVRLVDVNNNMADKYLVGKINVHAQSPRSYCIRTKVTDLNRNIEAVGAITLEKGSDLSRQNFLVKSLETDAPIFRNYVKLGEEITITYKVKMQGVNVYVRYYNREFPLAAPPFSMSEAKPFQYRPDSTYTLQFSDMGSVKFVAGKKGFYHLQLDTTKRDGLTLYNFSEVFPDVKRAEDMIPPLRFITSRQEYDDFMNNTNKKASIDKFWLDCTGNPDRAREIIRKYYNRVQDANAYFTSYIEGWKTDRGMVYLIYGAPNVIYRTANSETWTYGEENNINSLTYSFSKVDNPFTDNDFALERSAMYKQSWYSAVDIWRQGRAYLQD